MDLGQTAQTAHRSSLIGSTLFDKEVSKTYLQTTKEGDLL